MDPNLSVVQNLLIQGALVDKNGTPYNAELLKECKIFVLYFSAHWCPPCRQFTPILAEQFRIYRQTSSKAMVIFVSGDRSFQEQLNYMREAHGDWPGIYLKIWVISCSMYIIKKFSLIYFQLP